jgi:protein transport protein SEC31
MVRFSLRLSTLSHLVAHRCELKDPSGSCVSDIAWNPDQGLHLITAGGDDKNPVLKLWDLRSSTSLPLATLQGHTEGILSVSWCPSDPSLLLSCGKDNRTMLWDLFHLQPVYDIPSVESQPQGIQATASADENNFMFNNFSSTVGNRRYHVAWSPCLPAVISTCSFDRSVQFYSLSGAKSKLGRAPKWLRKPVGATFGFGGKLATFDNNPNTAAAATAAAADAKKGTSGASHNGSVEVKLYQVVETPELVSISNDFQEALAKGDYPAYCLHKAKVVTSHFDKQIWELMKIICFDKSAREGLLNYLGFDSNEVNTITQNYIHEVANQKDIKATAAAAAAAASSSGTGSDFAVTQLSNELQSKAIVSNINLTELVENVLTSQEAEPMIRQALVIGNFQLAVSCCLEAGLMTEALLLAQCGDNDLWLQTQQYYFTKMKTKYNFLNILQSVIKSELLEYVNTSDLNKWKETLAILSTYGKSEEFPMLCERLGARLYEEQHDLLSSTLCYMCAINIHQTIAHWIIDLKHRLTSSYAQQGAEKEGNNVENHTVGSIYALQEFIEKVMIYTQYNNTTASAPTQGSASTTPATAAPAATATATADGTAPNVQLSDECMYYFTEYSKLLASQGKTSIAAKYLKSNTYDEQVLRDRIYHSQYLKPMGSRPPPFPFETVVVNATAAALQDQKSQVPNQVHAKARGGSMDKTQQQQQAVGNQQKIGGAGGMPQATMQKQQPTTASSHLPHAHQGAAAASVQQIPTQQQQLGQQQAIQQQQHIPMAATPQNSQPQLPPGWLQLVDPSSGRPYYVDQATGQSHWEPPVAPAPAPAPAAPIPHHATPAATPAFQSNPQSVPQVREEPVYAPAQRSPSMPSAASPVAAAPAAAAPAAAVTSSSPSLAMSSDSSVGAIQNMFNDLQGSTPPSISSFPLLTSSSWLLRQTSQCS